MLIKNCKVWLEDKEQILDILIQNEKIVRVEKDINIQEEEIIDAKNRYVLPGIVDVHCHMREPGKTHKEDIKSGSKACARGGVTTFIDMPNTEPPTFTIQDLNNKKTIASNNSYVDFGFHFGTNGNNIDQIIQSRNQTASLKLFLNLTTGNLMLEDENVISEIFMNSKIVSTHAEDEKVDKAIAWANKYNTPLYVCHLSNEYELNAVLEAKKTNHKIYCEVTPHHLLFNKEGINESNRRLLLMKPELKTKHDNEVLLKALTSGLIDTIGTDHAPHLYEEKIAKDTYGIPSIEHSLELMWNFVKSKQLTVKRLMQLMCENPCLIFNIKNKGFIKQGYDGDLVIIDENDQSIIKENEIVTKAGWSPYVGFKRGCKVLTTIVRGNVVYNNGQYFEKKGKEIKYE